MVEQFEERVEASVDELRQQLAAAVAEVGGCQERLAAVEGSALPPLGAEELLALRERTEGLERRLETAQAGASGTSAAAAVRAPCFCVLCAVATGWRCRRDVDVEPHRSAEHAHTGEGSAG